MIRVTEQTILLISDDAELWVAVRQEFEAREEAPRVTTVSTPEAARRILEDAAPTVILLEGRAVPAESENRVVDPPRLDFVVSALATLVAAGAADFVATGGRELPLALQCVERRLQRAKQLAAKAKEFVTVAEAADGGAFGEILRHELNNPLTGILGNAELLLAEVQRKNDGQLPQHGEQRLETIAALAVRLRETVRRLSERWETRQP